MLYSWYPLEVLGQYIKLFQLFCSPNLWHAVLQYFCHMTDWSFIYPIFCTLLRNVNSHWTTQEPRSMLMNQLKTYMPKRPSKPTKSSNVFVSQVSQLLNSTWSLMTAKIRSLDMDTFHSHILHFDQDTCLFTLKQLIIPQTLYFLFSCWI